MIQFPSGPIRFGSEAFLGQVEVTFKVLSHQRKAAVWSDVGEEAGGISPSARQSI